MSKWPDHVLDRATAGVRAIDSAADDELLRLWVAASHALQQRGSVRSLANIPADLAEGIVASLEGGQRTPSSSPAVDVLGPDGTTYQVKALRRTDPGRNSIGTFSNFDFEQLIIVIFEWDLSARVGIRISAKALVRHRERLLTGSGHDRLTLTQRFCEHEAVQPIYRKELLKHHPLQPLVAWDPPRWETRELARASQLD